MTITVMQGDCRERLPELADGSVQCIVTSPPYFRQRSYLKPDDPLKPFEIGQEETPDAYVETIVGVMHECRRVLRDDGTLWINLGDCFASSSTYNAPRSMHSNAGWKQAGHSPNVRAGNGLKPKDLVGIPWMVAFALRADGWYLRADNVWGKPNGMPESCTDRTTRAHEYVFLLSKSERYYYDHEAVRSAPKASTQTQLASPYIGQSTKSHDLAGVQNASDIKRRIVDKQRGHSRRHTGFNERWDKMERDQQIAEGGNLRSVWWISPAQYAEEHFAVMPDQVAEICIRAGSRPGDVVCDPFAGVFTTCLVADRLQRHAIGIELGAGHCGMATRRLGRDAGLFADIRTEA
jgi:DNA modification methylase